MDGGLGGESSIYTVIETWYQNISRKYKKNKIITSLLTIIFRIVVSVQLDNWYQNIPINNNGAKRAIGNRLFKPPRNSLIMDGKNWTYITEVNIGRG